MSFSASFHLIISINISFVTSVHFDFDWNIYSSTKNMIISIKTSECSFKKGNKYYHFYFKFYFKCLDIILSNEWDCIRSLMLSCWFFSCHHKQIISIRRLNIIRMYIYCYLWVSLLGFSDHSSVILSTEFHCLRNWTCNFFNLADFEANKWHIFNAK